MESPFSSQPKKPKFLSSGYILAFISLFIFPIPIGITGAIIGGINIARGYEGHGIAQILLSLILGMMGAVIGVVAWSGGY